MDLTHLIPKFPDDVTVKELVVRLDDDRTEVLIEVTILLDTTIIVEPARAPKVANVRPTKPAGRVMSVDQRADVVVKYLAEHGGTGLSTEMQAALDWSKPTIRKAIERARSRGDIRLAGNVRGAHQYRLTAGKGSGSSKPTA